MSAENLLKILSLILLVENYLLNFCASSPTTVDSDSSNRVVFGHDIPVGEYVPYQVSLQYRVKSGADRHFCAGSIISPNRILTAGHCCHGLNPKRMSILAGVRKLNDTTGTRSQVTKCEMHEKYQATEFNDLAVLSIDPPLTFSDSIQAIDVSSRDLVSGNIPVTLTGWGLRLPVEFPFFPPNMENLNFPNTLQRLHYYTISNDNCREQGMSELSAKEICAQRKTSLLPQGACIGDSGGPLVTRTGKGNKVKQVGIVSYGFQVCGVFPDVYTRVSMYTGWIARKMA